MLSRLTARDTSQGSYINKESTSVNTSGHMSSRQSNKDEQRTEIILFMQRNEIEKEHL